MYILETKYVPHKPIAKQSSFATYYRCENCNMEAQLGDAEYIKGCPNHVYYRAEDYQFKDVTICSLKSFDEIKIDAEWVIRKMVRDGSKYSRQYRKEFYPKPNWITNCSHHALVVYHEMLVNDILVEETVTRKNGSFEYTETIFKKGPNYKTKLYLK